VLCRTKNRGVRWSFFRFGVRFPPNSTEVHSCFLPIILSPLMNRHVASKIEQASKVWDGKQAKYGMGNKQACSLVSTVTAMRPCLAGSWLACTPPLSRMVLLLRVRGCCPLPLASGPMRARQAHRTPSGGSQHRRRPLR
jgi:hypothetical protein